jgi:ferredoxin
MADRLDFIGKEAAGKMNELSLLADKLGPELVKRNSIGETINEIRFHPAYWDLMKIAVKSEMFRVKWEPSLREKFNNEKQLLGFASGYIYGLSECGQFCPLCMTDGVARLIDLFCDDEDKARLLPHIFTDNAEESDLRSMLKIPATNLSQDIYVSSVLPTNRIMAKDENVCLHCGLCAERCPTSAWDMTKFFYNVTKAGKCHA